MRPMGPPLARPIRGKVRRSRRSRVAGMPTCGGNGDPRVKPRHPEWVAAARSDPPAEHLKILSSAAFRGVSRRSAALPASGGCRPAAGTAIPASSGAGGFLRACAFRSPCRAPRNAPHGSATCKANPRKGGMCGVHFHTIWAAFFAWLMLAWRQRLPGAQASRINVETTPGALPR